MKVALTFDDGPSAWTEPILDLLDQHHAKATFFVVGANIPGRVDTIRRIVESGHTVGNHTTNHPDLAMLEPREVALELVETSMMLAEITGKLPGVWRAPYLHQPLNRPASMRHVGCDVIPGDWQEPNPRKIVGETIRQLQDGSVVLLHDGRPPGQRPHAEGGSLDTREATVDAVAELLYILRPNHEFVTV